MVQKSELLQVPVFADLPDDQVDWFISQSKELNVKAGETYVHQGDPADSMFVILDGQLQSRGEFGGETVFFNSKAGDIGGVLPFSRMKFYPVTGRAITDARAVRFPVTAFPQLIQKMPELTQRLVGLMSDRIREATRVEQQRDRLAGLGKLSAGLAHELNNPASAARRATSQLRDTLKRIKESSQKLGSLDLSPEQKSEIEKLEAFLMQQIGAPPLNGLALSNREEQIDTLLRAQGHTDLWQLAADLARRNVDPLALEQMLASMDASTARAALVRIAASL